MSEKKSSTTDFLANLFSPNYVFTQSMMFIAYYGLEFKMPKWVVWFPTYFYVGWIVVVLVILAIVGIINLLVN